MPPRPRLLVIARNAQPGPPLAALRLPVGAFPMEFEIDPADVLMQGRPFAGPISLSARIDTGGDPLTRDPQEPGAVLEGTVEPGAAGVELTVRRAG